MHLSPGISAAEMSESKAVEQCLRVAKTIPKTWIELVTIADENNLTDALETLISMRTRPGLSNLENLHSMLLIASKRGLSHLIGKLVATGVGATYSLEDAFQAAAAGGHIAAMEILKNSDKTVHLDDALGQAAVGGHTEVMGLLKSWGATDFNGALGWAAESGHTEVMGLLKIWGADDFNEALRRGAEGGHTFAMNLAISWGATDFNRALCIAASCGHIAAMELAKVWGAREFNTGLAHAASFGHTAAMTLVKDWGADDYNGALASAIAGNELEAMKLLKSWGATTCEPNVNNSAETEAKDWKKWNGLSFGYAFILAAGRDNPDAMALIRDWAKDDWERKKGDIDLYNRALVVHCENIGMDRTLETLTLLRTWGANAFQAAIEALGVHPELETLILLTQWQANITIPDEDADKENAYEQRFSRLVAFEAKKVAQLEEAAASLTNAALLLLDGSRLQTADAPKVKLIALDVLDTLAG